MEGFVLDAFVGRANSNSKKASCFVVSLISRDFQDHLPIDFKFKFLQSVQVSLELPTWSTGGNC